MALKFLPRLHDDLGGSGRRGCAHVRDKIGDREIAFVSHAAHNGNRARGNRPRHGFLVKRPQIFDGPAAARQQNHVHHLFAVEIFERRGDFLSRPLALHAHGINDQVQVRKTPPQNANDIAHGRAPGRRYDADATGQHGKRLLARLIEKSLGVETLLELLEGELQRADS